MGLLSQRFSLSRLPETVRKKKTPMEKRGIASRHPRSLMLKCFRTFFRGSVLSCLGVTGSEATKCPSRNANMGQALELNARYIPAALR